MAYEEMFNCPHAVTPERLMRAGELAQRVIAECEGMGKGEH